MIGRYSQIGIYRDLARSRQFYRVSGAGLLAVMSFLLDRGSESLPIPLRASLEAFKNDGATPPVVYQDKQPVGVLSVTDLIRPSACDMV